MAMRKRRDARLEALIAQAAKEIKQFNPHIGTPQEAPSDAQYAELERDRHELEQVWDELDRQQSQQPEGEPGAEAVDIDRGE